MMMDYDEDGPAFLRGSEPVPQVLWQSSQMVNVRALVENPGLAARKSKTTRPRDERDASTSTSRKKPKPSALSKIRTFSRSNSFQDLGDSAESPICLDDFEEDVGAPGITQPYAITTPTPSSVGSSTPSSSIPPPSVPEDTLSQSSVPLGSPSLSLDPWSWPGTSASASTSTSGSTKRRAPPSSAALRRMRTSRGSSSGDATTPEEKVPSTNALDLQLMIRKFGTAVKERAAKSASQTIISKDNDIIRDKERKTRETRPSGRQPERGHGLGTSERKRPPDDKRAAAMEQAPATMSSNPSSNPSTSKMDVHVPARHLEAARPPPPVFRTPPPSSKPVCTTLPPVPLPRPRSPSPGSATTVSQGSCAPTLSQTPSQTSLPAPSQTSSRRLGMTGNFTPSQPPKFSLSSKPGPPKSLGMRVGSASGRTKPSTFKVPFKSEKTVSPPAAPPPPPKPAAPKYDDDDDDEDEDGDISMQSAGDAKDGNSSYSSIEFDLDELDRIMAPYES